MSHEHDAPIELPGLSAQRSGPRAAVCTEGHVLSWFVDPAIVPKFCEKCGAPMLVACPDCNAPLPGDGEMLQWVPYHEHCTNCGNAFPWKAGAIARTKRTLAEAAELEAWSDEVKLRADELVDDIAAGRSGAIDVVTAMRWLERRGGTGAQATILAAIEHIGSMPLKQGLRADFPGLF